MTRSSALTIYSFSYYSKPDCRDHFHRRSLRVFQHFFDCGVAGKDATQTVLAKRDHSELNCLLFESDRRCARIDQFADRISNFQKFINPFSSFVAGIVTRLTSLAVIKLPFANVSPRNTQFCKQFLIRLVRLATLSANGSQQTLPEDGLQRGRNQKRLDAHVDQTRDCTGSVVRMQCGKNEMASQRRLNGDLRRL